LPASLRANPRKPSSARNRSSALGRTSCRTGMLTPYSAG
jgi:hypothetical protein